MDRCSPPPAALNPRANRASSPAHSTTSSDGLRGGGDIGAASRWALAKRRQVLRRWVGASELGLAIMMARQGARSFTGAADSDGCQRRDATNLAPQETRSPEQRAHRDSLARQRAATAATLVAAANSGAMCHTPGHAWPRLPYASARQPPSPSTAGPSISHSCGRAGRAQAEEAASGSDGAGVKSCHPPSSPLDAIISRALDRAAGGLRTGREGASGSMLGAQAAQPPIDPEPALHFELGMVALTARLGMASTDPALWLKSAVCADVTAATAASSKITRSPTSPSRHASTASALPCPWSCAALADRAAEGVLPETMGRLHAVEPPVLATTQARPLHSIACATGMTRGASLADRPSARKTQSNTTLRSKCAPPSEPKAQAALEARLCRMSTDEFEMLEATVA